MDSSLSLRMTFFRITYFVTTTRFFILISICVYLCASVDKLYPIVVVFFIPNPGLQIL